MTDYRSAATVMDRRAPVQANRRIPKGEPGHVAGTVSWVEHELAWQDYNRRHPGQSAERTAERGGFCYLELTDHLGCAPKTWMPR